MTATGRPRLEHMPALDGVRALAVIAVLLYHGDVGWARGGFLGVDIFFVLSGFLITALLLGEWDERGAIDLGYFWSRRARRLLPALFLVLCGVLLYAAAVAPRESLVALRSDVIAAVGYVANWRFIQSGHSYFDAFLPPSPIGHLWSLAIEEQFYVAWPLILLGLLALVRGRRGLLLVITVVMAATSAIVMAFVYRDPADSSRVFYGTDTRAQALLVGAALAMVGPHAHNAVRRSTRAVLGLMASMALVVLLVMCAVLTDQSTWLYNGGYAAVAVLAAIMLAGITATDTGPAGVVFRARPLRWVGRISYGLYLWHWPVDVFLTEQRVGIDGLALLALRLVTTLAVAVPSYYLLERPVRRGALTGWRPRAVVPAAALAIIAGIALISRDIVSPSATIARAATASRSRSSTQAMLVGDSVALSLGVGFQKSDQHGLSLVNAGTLGCGLVRGRAMFGGEAVNIPPHCAAVKNRWRDHLRRYAPNVVAGLWGFYDTRDHIIAGRRERFGASTFDDMISSDLDRVAELFSARGAHVVLLTMPYYGSPADATGAEREGPLDTRRVDHWNNLLRRAAARHPSTMSVIDLNRFLAPKGPQAESRGGTGMRWDGWHFTPEGAAITARWLAPQLRSIASTARPPSADVDLAVDAEARAPTVPLPAEFPRDIPLCPGLAITYAAPVPPASGFNLRFRIADAGACFRWMDAAVTSAGYPVIRRDFVADSPDITVFVYMFSAAGALVDLVYNEVEGHGLLLVTKSSSVH